MVRRPLFRNYFNALGWHYNLYQLLSIQYSADHRSAALVLHTHHVFLIISLVNSVRIIRFFSALYFTLTFFGHIVGKTKFCKITASTTLVLPLWANCLKWTSEILDARRRLWCSFCQLAVGYLKLARNLNFLPSTQSKKKLDMRRLVSQKNSLVGILVSQGITVYSKYFSNHFEGLYKFKSI